MIQPALEKYAALAALFMPLIMMCNSAFAAETIDDKVEALLAKMTLEEKVGQMNQYDLRNTTGPLTTAVGQRAKYDHIKQGSVGSVLNVTGAKLVRELQQYNLENTRLGIPLIFGLDVIHGHKTLFPIPLAEAASWDIDAIVNGARIAAKEAAARGINWTFAPMVDISRDPRWGRVMEGAGEDPYLGSIIGAARVRGFQGDDLSRIDTIAATAKHFAAYGFAEAGRDYNAVDIGNYTLHNVVLPPFKATVEANVKTVMNGFNTLNGIPVTGSSYLQRDLLKGQWNFDGFIVSDWGSVIEMVMHGHAADARHAAEIAAEAGSDMDMQSVAYVEHLADLAREGEVGMDIIDDAVRRILRVKYELGLFDDPYRYVNEEREKETIYHKEHLAAALDMAQRSIVLLKNETKLLPLSRNQKKIAVIGDFADDKNSPLGSWRIDSDDNTAVSLLEGLQPYTDQVIFARGTQVITGIEEFGTELEVNTTDRSEFDEAIELAKNSDVVIMMLGEHGFHAAEGRSRAHLDMPGLQEELLKNVYAVNKNIILLVTNGRPLILTWASEHIPTIAVTWHLGTQSGNAIAKVLFGDYNPSGKLPMTFPRSMGQIPIYYNNYRTGRPVPGPNKRVFWSHYMDESSEPLYPFGYGLSYTEFEYSKLQVDASNNNAVKVSVAVKNIGDYAGEEVVQLYLNDKAASIVRPVKELKGFKKIALKKGESQTIDFILSQKELGFYNHEGEFVFEPGDFEVMVGTDSNASLTAAFSL